jgi:drug/metabolite transporter (DMT)-like permease
MVAVALALGSSVMWGLADFLGGVQARRVPLAAVMLVSQGAALAVLAAVVTLLAGDPPPFADLWPAAAGGLAGAIALSAFYRGLAIGTMSIVAPISATGALVPVVVGLATGDRPSALQVVGMAVAVTGVVLASREESDDADAAQDSRRSIALALVAALGFGSFFVGMERAAEADVTWALFAARSASVGLLTLAVLIARPGLRAPAPALAILTGVGLMDLGANALFAVASTKGLLSVVGVLGSLYPIATIVLARVVLGERVRRVQEVGIVLAMAGVAAIAGG